MSRRPARGGRAVYSRAEVSLGKAAGRRRRGYTGTVLLAGVILAGAFAAGTTRTGSSIIFAIQRFLEFYVDVFALVALTATVGLGLIATDRIIMAAGHRIVLQGFHRALSLLAMAFLGTHIVLEVLEGNARLVDAVVPFLDPHRALYVGLGTISSDLLVVIAATGLIRRRFTGGARPVLWRVLHWTTYAAWPMAIVHGLLAGRHAKPYVDWSYGACMIAVGVALAVRAVAEVRPREVRRQPVAESAGHYLQVAAQAAMQARLAAAGAQPRALPAAPAAQYPAGHLPAGSLPPAVSPSAGFPSVGSAPPVSPSAGFPSVGPASPVSPVAGFPSVRPAAPPPPSPHPPPPPGFGPAEPAPPASPPTGFPSVRPAPPASPPPAPPASPPVGFPRVRPASPVSPVDGFPSVRPAPPVSPVDGFPSVRPAPPASPPVGFPSVGQRGRLSPRADEVEPDPDPEPRTPWLPRERQRRGPGRSGDRR